VRFLDAFYAPLLRRARGRVMFPRVPHERISCTVTHRTPPRRARQHRAHPGGCAERPHWPRSLLERRLSV